MSLTIPAQWSRAASFFADLRSKSALTEDEWDTILEWLSTTPFDDHSYLAGEVAAGLVRDLAPQSVRNRFLASSDCLQPWLDHFRQIVGSETNNDVPCADPGASISRP